MPVDFEAWVAEENERIVLVTVSPIVNGSSTTRYLASRTWVSSGSDSPANTIFDGRLGDETEIVRGMGAIFGRTADANAGEVRIVNADGELDSWIEDSWEGREITMRLGDPSWAYADFETIFLGTVAGISATDLELILSVRDRSVELDDPIQSMVESRGTRIGDRRPLCYGYPKNISPIVHDPDSSPEYRVHEFGESEDVAVTRYVNQAPSTSPSITKRNNNSDFELASDPDGPVTVDVKGALDPVGGTWLEKTGEILQHMLTRTHGSLVGLCRGPGTGNDQIVLPDDASDTDDVYNGNSLRKTVFSETGEGDVEQKTVSDYDGATRTITVDTNWTDNPVAGDGFILNSTTTQYGPLTTSDLDTDSFDQLDTDIPNQIGVYIDGGQSANQVLQEILVGAWYAWKRSGKLAVGVLSPDGNLLPYPTDYSEWTNTWGGGVTITEDAAIAPDGTMRATLLERIDGADDGVHQQSITLTASTVYVVEVEFKNDDSAQSQILVYDDNAAGNLASLTIDWTSGVPSTNASSGASEISYGELEDDWHRARFKITTAATVTTHQLTLLPSLNANGEGIYVWRSLIGADALELDESDVEGDIEIEKDLPPVYRLRLGYDRNYSPQSGGATDNVTPARAAYVKREYRYEVKEDRGLLDYFDDPRDIDLPTYYTDKSETRTEALRLWDLFSTQRYWYRFRTSAKPFQVDVGDVISLSDTRYGLDAPRRLTVVEITEYPTQGKTDLTLWG